MSIDAASSEKPFMPSAGDRAALLAWARESIAARLEGRAAAAAPTSPALEREAGAFVTLSCAGSLRGCIGRISASGPLVETVHEMAMAAAFEDPRFSPLSAKELPEIEIEITILTPLAKLSSIEDIEIGRHGLYLVKGWHSGLLLPQVPTEYGWDRDTFLEQLCYKAGLPKGAWREADAELFSFEGAVFNEGGLSS
jgi:AmmeMemoRadiSam system protein A